MHDNFEGHKIVMRQGYEAIYLPEYHSAYADGLVYVHIYVAERKLGRALLSSEVVHHADFNKTNNDEDNLIIFASNSDHVRYHNLLRSGKNFVLFCIDGIYYCREYMGRESDLDSFPITKNQKLSKICPICGGIKAKGANICHTCIQIERSKNLPDLKLLINSLRQYKNFVKVGKIFGVTDNAVRKWCVKYGIPRSSMTIRNLSDDEWESLYNEIVETLM